MGTRTSEGLQGIYNGGSWTREYMDTRLIGVSTTKVAGGIVAFALAGELQARYHINLIRCGKATYVPLGSFPPQIGPITILGYPNQRLGEATLRLEGVDSWVSPVIAFSCSVKLFQSALAYVEMSTGEPLDRYHELSHTRCIALHCIAWLGQDHAPGLTQTGYSSLV
jgi:hypothetical protein